MPAWEVAEGSTASAIWLERSEGNESWSRPATERRKEGSVTVELDRSAAVDREYWYRLAAEEVHGVVIL